MKMKCWRCIILLFLDDLRQFFIHQLLNDVMAIKFSLSWIILFDYVCKTVAYTGWGLLWNSVLEARDSYTDWWPSELMYSTVSTLSQSRGFSNHFFGGENKQNHNFLSYFYIPLPIWFSQMKETTNQTFLILLLFFAFLSNQKRLS